jgi:hypothetical protein
LHTAVSNGSDLFPYWNSDASKGVESHAYLPKDPYNSGTPAKQYMDTEVRADCQVDGNAFCISLETWDGAGVVWDGRDANKCPPWLTAQVKWIAQFLADMHIEHGIPLRRQRYWNDSGIGYHSQFIGDPGYARNPRACPCPARIAQIPGLIAMAIKIVENGTQPVEDDVTEQDKLDIINGVYNKITSEDGLGKISNAILMRGFAEYDAGADGTRDVRSVADILYRTEAEAQRLAQRVTDAWADDVRIKLEVIEAAVQPPDNPQ